MSTSDSSRRYPSRPWRWNGCRWRNSYPSKNMKSKRHASEQPENGSLECVTIQAGRIWCGTTFKRRARLAASAPSSVSKTSLGEFYSAVDGPTTSTGIALVGITNDCWERKKEEKKQRRKENRKQQDKRKEYKRKHRRTKTTNSQNESACRSDWIWTPSRVSWGASVNLLAPSLNVRVVLTCQSSNPKQSTATWKPQKSYPNLNLSNCTVTSQKATAYKSRHVPVATHRPFYEFEISQFYLKAYNYANDRISPSIHQFPVGLVGAKSLKANITRHMMTFANNTKGLLCLNASVQSGFKNYDKSPLMRIQDKSAITLNWTNTSFDCWRMTNLQRLHSTNIIENVPALMSNYDLLNRNLTFEQVRLFITNTYSHALTKDLWAYLLLSVSNTWE